MSDAAKDLTRTVGVSGVNVTKGGASYALPASTGTKAAKGTYSFVAPDGETVTYYGIRFAEAGGAR